MGRSKQKGFTIVELLIATTVFSIIMLTALTGFLEIGRLFYKGVSATNTQTIANQVSQDILGNFTTAGNVSGPNSGNGYTYYCIGNTRYTYDIGYEVSSSASPNHAAPAGGNGSSGGNFGLLRDVMPGSSACGAPCNDQVPTSCPTSTVKFNNPTELLGDKMRIDAFSVQPGSSTPNFYNLSIVIAYGDDDRLAYTTPNDPSTVYCAGNSSNQFCAVSQITTSAYRGGQ